MGQTFPERGSLERPGAAGQGQGCRPVPTDVRARAGAFRQAQGSGQACCGPEWVNEQESDGWWGIQLRCHTAKGFVCRSRRSRRRLPQAASSERYSPRQAHAVPLDGLEEAGDDLGLFHLQVAGAQRQGPPGHAAIPVCKPQLLPRRTDPQGDTCNSTRGPSSATAPPALCTTAASPAAPQSAPPQHPAAAPEWWLPAPPPAAGAEQWGGQAGNQRTRVPEHTCVAVAAHSTNCRAV